MQKLVLIIVWACVAALGCSQQTDSVGSNGSAASIAEQEGGGGGTYDHHVGLVIRFNPDDANSVCTVCADLNKIPLDRQTGEGLLEHVGALGNVNSAKTCFAGLGAAVCRFGSARWENPPTAANPVGLSAGCGDPNNCFCDDEHYWSYFNRAGFGWQVATTGPSSRELVYGDVDGWSWYPLSAQAKAEGKKEGYLTSLNTASGESQTPTASEEMCEVTPNTPNNDNNEYENGTIQDSLVGESPEGSPEPPPYDLDQICDTVEWPEIPRCLFQNALPVVIAP